MIKDFGKVLDIYLVNKGISSDGCFLGNSTCVAQSSNWKSRKIWMYMTQMRYKIQMYSVLRNKELWFWLPEDYKGDFKFIVNKLSKYRFDTLFELGTTQQRELPTTLGMN